MDPDVLTEAAQTADMARSVAAAALADHHPHSGACAAVAVACEVRALRLHVVDAIDRAARKNR